jgi:hypothetical protein
LLLVVLDIQLHLLVMPLSKIHLRSHLDLLARSQQGSWLCFVLNEISIIDEWTTAKPCVLPLQIQHLRQ